MPEQIIIIPGKPIAKRRPRFARRGKFVMTYSDQETEEGRALWEVKQQWKLPPLDCPIICYMTFLFPITKSSVKKETDMLNGTTKHIKKPDIDNAGKFYLDVMNGLIFRDDRQVYELGLEKGFAREPQTIIRVEW